MKKIVFLLLTAILTTKAFSALPPLYSTLDEIQAILSDGRLGEELGSAEPIFKIERIEEGYLITTLRYQLKVDVVEIPQFWRGQPILGPSKFELEFHRKVPIERINSNN